MTVVIVGAGQAGATAAAALRDIGFADPVILLGDEQEPPYERPPLTKGYLAGDDDAFTPIQVPGDVDVRTGVTVQSIDPAARTVSAGGERIGYDALLLAPGVAPKVPDLPGADSAFYVREHGDSRRLRDEFTDGRRVVVLGGGWIGCEASAVARERGCEVSLLEFAPTLVPKLGPEIGGVYGDLHREHGVDVRTGVTASRVVVRDGRAAGVGLEGGDVVDGDVVVVATGTAPRLSLARSAGLAIDDATGGVAVDASMRSSVPGIWVAGDIAAIDHPLLGRRVRVEHWALALDGGKVAARSIAGAPGSAVDFLPFFFSDQYDFSMEYCGNAAPGDYERVVFRGATTGNREFVAFWQADDDRVLAAMNANVWDVNETLQRLVVSRKPVAPERLADPDVPLEELQGGA